MIYAPQEKICLSYPAPCWLHTVRSATSGDKATLTFAPLARASISALVQKASINTTRTMKLAKYLQVSMDHERITWSYIMFLASNILPQIPTPIHQYGVWLNMMPTMHCKRISVEDDGQPRVPPHVDSPGGWQTYCPHLWQNNGDALLWKKTHDMGNFQHHVMMIMFIPFRYVSQCPPFPCVETFFGMVEWLVVSTHLKNMKVSWVEIHYTEKSNWIIIDVPKHQPEHIGPSSLWFHYHIPIISPSYCGFLPFPSSDYRKEPRPLDGRGQCRWKLWKMRPNSLEVFMGKSWEKIGTCRQV